MGLVLFVWFGFFQTRLAVYIVSSTVDALVQPDSNLFSLTAEGYLGFEQS